MYTRDARVWLRSTTIRSNRHDRKFARVHTENHGGSIENPKHLVEAFLFLEKIHFSTKIDPTTEYEIFGQMFRSSG